MASAAGSATGFVPSPLEGGIYSTDDIPDEDKDQLCFMCQSHFVSDNSSDNFNVYLGHTFMKGEGSFGFHGTHLQCGLNLFSTSMEWTGDHAAETAEDTTFTFKCQPCGKEMSFPFALQSIFGYSHSIEVPKLQEQVKLFRENYDQAKILSTLCTHFMGGIRNLRFTLDDKEDFLSRTNRDDLENFRKVFRPQLEKELGVLEKMGDLIQENLQDPENVREFTEKYLKRIMNENKMMNTRFLSIVNFSAIADQKK